ncbi:hypothetical protein D3C86_1972610 [compost metagenome]
MRHTQVLLQAAFKLVTVLPLPQSRQALPQLTLDNAGEQLVFRREMAIEGAATQANRFHQAVHAHR